MVLPLLLLTFSSIIITHSRVAEARLTPEILFPPEDDSPALGISVPKISLPDIIPKLPFADVIGNYVPLPRLPFPKLTANKAVQKTP